MQLIFLIPTFILLSTVITFVLLNKALTAYIGKIEIKTKTIQRISLLLIASDFVSLFSSSESRRLVENLIRAENNNDDSFFESLSTAFGGAGNEIEKLYTEISKAYRPSEELSRIKVSAAYLKTTLLFFGLAVSITQYLIAFLFDPTKSNLFPPLAGDLLIATVLFSLIILYISLYINRTSRRIEIRYSKLEGVHSSPS